jgi:2-C-methyl-D-erythritol 4-phosphate cytidylyltransferase
MKTTVLIAAAGAGQRMGMGRPKAFLLLEGRPLVAWSLELFQQHPAVDAIVLLAPAAQLPEARACAAGYSKVAAVEPGGERRQDTVARGLAALRTLGLRPDDVVLVHDAARPLATAGLVSAVLEAARRTGAAVPGLAPSDTVKRARAGRVAATLAREDLVLIQTPQGFRLSVLEAAMSAHGAADVTDDAALVEAMGAAVEVVPGEASNMKITAPADLALASALLRGRAGAAPEAR